MKTWYISFFISLLLLAIPGGGNAFAKESPAQNPEELDVYLCIGQSNMAGRGTLLPELVGTLEGVYLLNDRGEFEPASNPLNKYSTIRKDLSMQALSPAYSFARKMAALSPRPVGLVVNARGGGSIDSWLKGSKDGYYEAALERVRLAQKQGGVLKAVIWHQGESDCQAPEAYRKKLSLLVETLRADLGMPELPFVFGQLSEWNWTSREEGTAAFNAMLAGIPSTLAWTACVSSQGLDWLKDETDPHFGTAGQLILGERYADAVWGLFWQQAEERAKELVSQMTLEEKIDYISGPKSFYIRAIPRLGIPEIHLADGPQGIRNNTRSTLYPAGILSAATWNRALVEQLGHGLGRDAKARGIDILLGPGVNIYRSPLCGRNYEYFGEDPYLSGETAKHYIIGVQKEGVMATVKHFAANNQEWSRHHASSDVDERTLQEIYFPAFRKAVQEANVAAVMDSYNPVNGVHATENRWMNIDVLRHQWGFRGILMSDWSSVYSGVGAANGGLDLEMPVGKFMTKEVLLPAIANGIVTEQTIDAKVCHILQTLMLFGAFDHPTPIVKVEQENEASKATALALAREGIVLLKNRDNTLPYRKGHTLVLGPNADVIPTGGGSGFVTPHSTTSLYKGLVNLVGGKHVRLLSDSLLYKDISPDIYTDSSCVKRGFKARYYNSVNLGGEVFRQQDEAAINYAWKYGAPFPGLPDDKYSACWTAVYRPQRSGTVQFQLAGDDGYRLFVNDKLLTGDWGNHSYSTRNAFMQVEAGRDYRLRVEYFDNAGEATIRFHAGLLDEELLVSALKKADNVVVCVGFNSSIEGEGFDRPFALPYGQEYLIDKVTALHDNVTVAVNAGGGIDFRNWGEKAEAILMAWYPGQEGGQALAEIISGRISPSGKLPITIEKQWEDNPVHDHYYDTRNVPHKRVQYAEGVFVGYRGYERTGTQPLYPFGYGLSYSSFRYSNLDIRKVGDNLVSVSFDLKNTGKVDAAEVAQVYVGDVEASVPRPKKELKGYEKVFLKRGEQKRVSLLLDAEAFAYYDVCSKQFIVEHGDFNIWVGSSSEALPLQGSIRL